LEDFPREQKADSKPKRETAALEGANSDLTQEIKLTTQRRAAVLSKTTKGE